MPKVSGLTGTPTTPQGYRVRTKSGGKAYHTILRRDRDAEEDDEETVVEVDERYSVDEQGNREDLELTATDAVEAALEDRGVTVA